MENDPMYPYTGEDDLDSLPSDTLEPPDPSWGDFFDGVWRRMTNPLPPTMTT